MRPTEMAHEIESDRWVEPALKQSHLLFHSLLDALPAGAYTCDPDGLITYYNQHAVKLWGRAPRLHDPVDRFCGSFKLFASDGTPIAHDECWMALALRHRREFNGREILIERPDGWRLTVLAHANPILDEKGQLLGAVNVLVDISERKRAEDALMKADRAKNEFLATLAHELRNPLAPIRNAIQILHLKGTPYAELQPELGVIDRQIQQMTRLIDDLLDIARITENKLELRHERLDLSTVVATALETGRPLITQRDQALTVSLPTEPVMVEGDLTRLSQAVSNLLTNAAKYTEQGGRISVTATREGSDAVVRVRDSGIGIPAAMLPRIFEMFMQVQPSAERAQGGLGVGLALVQRLIELHGGTVDAQSDGPGRGAEFVIRLPAEMQSKQPAASDDIARTADPLAQSMRILVVDDNHDSADSLGTLLRLLGNEIRVAHDGVEAVRAAGEFRPDVVLLDIGLPRVNGFEAARAIRAQPWGADILLVATTGWGQESDRQNSMDAGFDHHMVKPIDTRLLLQLLSRGPGRPARGATPTP